MKNLVFFCLLAFFSLSLNFAWANDDDYIADKLDMAEHASPVSGNFTCLISDSSQFLKYTVRSEPLNIISYYSDTLGYGYGIVGEVNHFSYYRYEQVQVNSLQKSKVAFLTNSFSLLGGLNFKIVDDITESYFKARLMAGYDFAQNQICGSADLNFRVRWASKYITSKLNIQKQSGITIYEVNIDGQIASLHQLIQIGLGYKDIVLKTTIPDEKLRMCGPYMQIDFFRCGHIKIGFNNGDGRVFIGADLNFPI